MVRGRRLSPQTVAVLVRLGAAGAGWSHGYELCRGLGLKAGTVYPILMRLAERGLVETAWETSPPRGRPARHLYRLTAAGGELAATAAAEAAEAERDRAAGSRPARLAPGTA